MVASLETESDAWRGVGVMNDYPKLPYIQIWWGYVMAIGIWANGEIRVRCYGKELIMEKAVELVL